jgi:hypothetical protein
LFRASRSHARGRLLEPSANDLAPSLGPSKDSGTPRAPSFSRHARHRK